MDLFIDIFNRNVLHRIFFRRRSIYFIKVLYILLPVMNNTFLRLRKNMFYEYKTRLSEVVYKYVNKE